MTDAPLFVVGSPRSGTTLFAAMLAAHSRLDCGPETFFFVLGPRRQRARAAASQGWPDRAVDYLAGLRLAGEPVHRLFDLDLAEIRRRLEARPPSVQAMLEALTATRAAARGKPRWIEKTPSHLFHVEEIRELYPSSPVIRLVRDPRDVALSLTRVPWGHSSALVNLHEVMQAYAASHSFFARDRISLTVRFEDLLADPVATLSEVCTRIGERFEDGMLDTSGSGRSLAGAGEWWKADASGRLDRDRIAVWQRELEPDSARVLTLAAHHHLVEFGYPTGPGARVTIVLQGLHPRRDEQLLATAASHDVCVVRLNGLEEAALEADDRRVLLRADRSLFGDGALSAAVGVVRLVWLLLRRRAAGRPLGWLPGRDRGLAAALQAAITRLLGATGEPTGAPRARSAARRSDRWRKAPAQLSAPHRNHADVRRPLHRPDDAPLPHTGENDVLRSIAGPWPVRPGCRFRPGNV